MNRDEYAAVHGPTTGDRVQLATPGWSSRSSPTRSASVTSS